MYPSLAMDYHLHASCAAGAVVYLIFKNTETINTRNLCFLLILVPFLLGSVLSTLSKETPLLRSFVVYFSTIISCTVLYRLSPWHPLARYPGPFICKITKFKMAFVSRNGKQHLYYRKLHQKYGDVVRTGPNELSLLTVASVNSILGHVPRGSFWEGRVPEDSVRPLGAIGDWNEHRKRRAPWSKAFTSVALKEYEVLVKEKTETLARRLAANGGSEEGLEIGEWLGYYTYDVMTEFAFSGESDMLHKGDPLGLWEEIRGGLVKAMFVSHVPWLGRLCYRLPQKYFTGLRAFRQNSQEKAMKRLAEGTKRKDLYYYLLDDDDEAKMHGERKRVTIVADGSTAVLAGSDTTSTTTTLICYYLLTRPTVYERLIREVNAAGDGWNDASFQAKMGYLNAVINEVLRLWPAVLNGSPRTIRPDAPGRMVGEHYVPPGTSITIPTYSVHRDPRNFSPCPEEFIPERWVDDSGMYTNNASAFLAFSAGPANCVGKNLAMMEMRMVVCMLVKRFDMELTGVGSRKGAEGLVRDYYTMQVGEVWVRFKEREMITV